MFMIKYLTKIFLTYCLIFVCLTIIIVKPIVTYADNNLQVIFQNALEKSNNGDCENALKYWDEFLSFSPNEVSAISNRANCFLILGNLDEALEEQKRALQLDPLSIEVHLNKGIAEEALQMWDQAENDYKWILNKNPQDTSALYNLSNVMGTKGEWKKAKDLLDQAIRIRPGFAMAKSSKALVEYQLGEFKQAEADLRSLTRKYPMFPDSRAALSAILSRNKLVGEAKSNWVAAEGLDKRYSDKDWLLDIRRWPPLPTDDLMIFLRSQNS